MNLNDKNVYPSEEAFKRVARKEAEKRHEQRKREQEEASLKNQVRQRILANPLIQVLAKKLDLKQDITKAIISGTMAGIVAISGILVVKKAIDENGPTIVRGNEIVRVSDLDKNEENTPLEDLAETAIKDAAIYEGGGPVTEKMIAEFYDNPEAMEQLKNSNVSYLTETNSPDKAAFFYHTISEVNKNQEASTAELEKKAEEEDTLSGAIAEKMLDQRPLK